MIHACGHHHTTPSQNCATPALPGLDYCKTHLTEQKIYCAVRHCTREQLDDNNVLCVSHHDEWLVSELAFEAWAKTRHNSAAITLAAARKVHGGK